MMFETKQEILVALFVTLTQTVYIHIYHSNKDGGDRVLRRKVLPISIIILSLLGTSALPTQANELGDAVGQQKDVITQKNQASGQLNQLTYTADKIKAQMAELEAKITQAQVLLGQKQASSAEAQKQVLSAQKELDLKQKQLEDRRVALGKRAKGIYESEQVSYLEVLFQSADLDDFLTRMDYCTKLVSNDRQLLTDIQGQKEQIVQKKHELQSKSDQAAQLQVQATLVSADLDKTKSEQRVTLDQNQKDQQAAFDNVDQLDAASKAIGDKIRKMQAALAAQEAQAAQAARSTKATHSTQATPKGSVSGPISNWPVPGFYEISDPFGWRTHPITGKQSLHTGTDIVAPTGTEIRSAGAGIVLTAGWNSAYGNMTIISNGNGITTLYGHQSSLAVTEGQVVQVNQVIGYVGSTGWSTGAHLHFEVSIGGNPTDPLQYFRN